MTITIIHSKHTNGGNKKKMVVSPSHVYNPYVEYKMKYPGKEAYHFPTGITHTSPCMDIYWRSKPIRQGNNREEIDFE